MPVSTQTYRILIASPSDLAEERDAAEKAIQDWNAQHAVAQGVTLLPTRWETHAYPETGVRPQEAVNKQLVQDGDILVAMFWTRLGKETEVAASGTVEEIDQFVAAGKHAMLYFSSRPVDPNKIDSDQHQKLQDFKKKTYDTALVGKFASPEEFRTILLRDLTNRIYAMKAKAKQGQEQMVGYEQRRQAVAKLRDEFEDKAKGTQFYKFKAQAAILALSIIPANRPAEAIEYTTAKHLFFYKLLQPIGVTGGDINHEPKATICCTGADTSNAVTELRDDGSLMAVRNLIFGRDAIWSLGLVPQVDISKPWILNMEAFQPQLISSLLRYLIGLKQLGVVGPWFVGISLLKMHNAILSARETSVERYAHGTVKPFQMGHDLKSDIVAGMVTVEADADLSNPNEFEKLLKRPLKDIWKHCGYFQFPKYSPAGEVNWVE
jgi:hypothetical protein